nr:MAG: hypothetical protein DIU75_13180 [Mycolicibacterium hassiacum]
MQPTVSTIPAALRALVAAARRAIPPAVIRGRTVPVTVTLGQPTRGQVGADDIVCIAFTGEPGEAAVTSTRERQQAAAAPDRESYQVACLASSWRGRHDDAEPVLDRTFEMINAFAAELAADQTLGGVVMTCRLTTDETAIMQTEQGATVVTRFTLSIEAFTSAGW